MATRTETHLIDDITGEAADETVTFALNGKTYEIDLSTDNASALRDALSGFVEHARRTNAASTPRKARSKSSGDSEAEAIRQWARGEGLQVADRGRIAADVRRAYEERHATTASTPEAPTPAKPVNLPIGA